MEPDKRQIWLLAIIDSAGHVDGSTRLQKYGLLACHIILEDQPAYNDWAPHHYGAFSSQLASDVKLLTKHGFVDVSTVARGYEFHRYSVSDRGKRILIALAGEQGRLVQRIRMITDHYSDKPLDDLLADAYSLFPQYTGNSKIASRVRHAILKRDTRPDSRFALPYTDKTVGLSSITSTAMINPFPYNDEDARRKLAKQIGLSDVPPIDIKAFDETPDIWDQGPLSDSDLEEIVDGE